MNILIVDNNDSFTYNLKQLLDNSELCTYEIIKTENIQLNSIQKFDKIIISPGPGLPSEQPILQQIILNFHDKLPILGVCLGFQAIVESFGGKIHNLHEPVHGITKSIKIISDDKLFKGLASEIKVGLYHSWAALKSDIPDALNITSETKDGLVMSVKHKETELRGVQFHPESIMTEYGQQIINNWIKCD